MRPFYRENLPSYLCSGNDSIVAEKMHRTRKLKLLIVIWALATPALVTHTFADTVSFYDSFFFADNYVAEVIVATGEIPEGATTEDLRFWGKIGTVQKQPAVPLLMAIGNLLTGLPLYFFHSHLPVYLITTLIFYLISRQFMGPEIAFSVAFAAGAIAPYLGSNLSGFRGTRKLLLFLIAYILIRQLSSAKLGRVSSFIVPILLIHLLYNYPRLFILSSLLVFCSTIYYWTFDLPVSWTSLGAIGLGVWVILSTPFTTYSHYISLLFIKISGYGTTLASQEGVNVMETSLLGLAWFPPLLVLGAIGGLLTFRSALSSIRKRLLDQHVLLIVWGIATSVFAGSQLITAEGWLLARSLGDAFPVMALGAGIAIESISSLESINRPVMRHAVAVVMILFLIFPVGVSFVYNESSSVRTVHSYTDDDIAVKEWSARYIPPNGSVFSDTQHSALLVGEQPASVYPMTESSTQAVFYQGRVEEAPSHDYLWLNEEMNQVGFYVASFPRQPIPSDQYYYFHQSNQVIYSTERSVIIVD